MYNCFITDYIVSYDLYEIMNSISKDFSILKVVIYLVIRWVCEQTLGLELSIIIISLQWKRDRR